jgi:hypothetical protein
MPEIIEWEPQRDRGNLKAFFSVRIGQVILHDFRLVQQPGQKAYVQAPIRTWVKPDGKIGYGGPLVVLPEETMRAILRVAYEKGTER